MSFYNDRGFNGNRNGGGFRDRQYSYNNGGGSRSNDRYDDRRGGGRREGRKRTGAKFGISPKSSKPYIQGWNANKQGLLKFVASPTKKGMVSEQCEQWCAKVQLGRSEPYLQTCFYNVNSKKLTFPDLGMEANPNAPGGGYFGTFTQKRR